MCVYLYIMSTDLSITCKHRRVTYNKLIIDMLMSGDVALSGPVMFFFFSIHCEIFFHHVRNIS